MCIRFDISYCGTPDDGDRLMTRFRLSALEVALEMCVIYEKASFLLGSWAFLFTNSTIKFSVCSRRAGSCLDQTHCPLERRHKQLLFEPDNAKFSRK